MSAAAWIVGALLFIAYCVVVWRVCNRYTSARLEAARVLREQGWIQVGFDFLTGPVMRPPPNRYPTTHPTQEADK